MTDPHGPPRDVSEAQLRRVVFASALGTIFEWYDFFIYGTLAGIFGRLFFPSASAMAGFLLALATFGAGFAVRPLGAVVFGHFGDRVGRKYTFLVTITLMGFATAAIGLLPTYASIGILAPALLVALRLVQGFAVGGEYGGASIYVAEHAPKDRRGFYTCFIQMGPPAALIMTLVVSMIAIGIVGEGAWDAWGWRIPFLVSIPLLAFSLWMRFKLAESPVFQAMKEAGGMARNPLIESLNSWPKIVRLIAAMFLSAGQAVLGFTLLFRTVYFLHDVLHVPAATARLIVAIGTFTAFPPYFAGAWLSDRYGRKRVTVIAYAVAVLTLFPGLHLIADHANPGLTTAWRDRPVVVSGTDCRYDPFETPGQRSACGRVLDRLTTKGVAFSIKPGPAVGPPVVTVGGVTVDPADPNALDAQLALAGHSSDPVTPAAGDAVVILLAMALLYLGGGCAYGAMGAWLVELFPSRTRYTSLSIPYHLGSGVVGGFMPLISQYIVARTGDPFAGFWYPLVITILALIASAGFLPETSGRDLD